jgi:hypothetical protein
MNTKTLYFIKHIALVALFAVGFMLVPNAGTVLAQKGAAKEVATTEMLSYALNLKSVADVAVSGENVSDKGDSTITNGYKRGSVERNGAERGGVNRKDLADIFSAINQLPCSEVADTNLSDKTFGPGVYCLASADLTSRLVLDGQNNPNAIFVFRIAGGLNVKSGSMIGLDNDAQASSVFFVSNDSAIIGDGASIKGNIIARNDIGIGADSTIDGRVLSVKGDVALGANSILGPEQTGILEICKAVDPAVTSSLANRIFRFQIGALIAEVPAGQCSGPLVVPSGPGVITELQTGRVTDGTTFNGNFQLTGVTVLGQTPTTAITSVNLPAFTANVNIRAGDISNQTRLQFTNRFAITAIVEICKEALDSGVTGFFMFTINELRDGAGVLIPFTVPVGQCTGPIAVVVASDPASGPPRQGQVTVNELPRTGFIFTNATTALGTAAPTNRLVGFNVLANGGGNATVIVVAGFDGGITTAGGTAVQTTVFFNNRSAPAILKVCKIAGPGIPELAPFDFSVTGTQPLAAITTAQGPQPVPVGGTAAVGATLAGGTVVTQVVRVLAGPAANGGFCQVVPGTFVVDSLATITELPNIFTNFTNFNAQSRVSRITSSSGITAPVIRAPGVAFFPLTGGVNTGTADTRTVTVPIIREAVEVEFVNVALVPVPLKICKVAGTGVAVGTPFNFTVTADTAGGLLAPFSSTLTVQAGPASTGLGTQNGFCDFAAGPFTNPNINGLTSFNFNSTITVTEGATTGVSATSITSPTGGVVANLINRTATTTMIFGVNEIQFVNSATVPTIKSRKRTRFF